jgi:hypothetical protein
MNNKSIGIVLITVAIMLTVIVVGCVAEPTHEQKPINEPTYKYTMLKCPNPSCSNHMEGVTEHAYWVHTGYKISYISGSYGVVLVTCENCGAMWRQDE